jgi:hypothetical protein
MKPLISLILLVWTTSLYSAPTANFFPTSDDEDCLMCHRYERLGRITKDGDVKSYFVQQEKFFLTAHREVSCRECHTEIDEIPHKTIIEGVNCATECHVNDPETGDRFSHADINEVYLESSHGRQKLVEGGDLLKPYCSSCHLNPIFNPHGEPSLEESITACIECHHNTESAEQKWFEYKDQPIDKPETRPLAVINVCGSCHGDPLYMEDREISARSRNAYESYRDSFHGKYAQLDNNVQSGEDSLISSVVDFIWDRPPHCMDCHAETDGSGTGIHNLRSVDDPQSTIHVDRVSEACNKCHEDTNQAFAMITEVHNFRAGYSTVEAVIYEIFFWLVGSVFFILTLRITLDHNRKIIDRLRGEHHEPESQDLQESM